jgi:hypothetical protein
VCDVSERSSLPSCLLRGTPCIKYSSSLLLFLFFCFSLAPSSSDRRCWNVCRANERIRSSFESLDAELSSSASLKLNPEVYENFAIPHLTFCWSSEQICSAQCEATFTILWLIFLHNFRDSAISCILILDYNLISLFIRITLLSLRSARWRQESKLARFAIGAKPRVTSGGEEFYRSSQCYLLIKSAS